ncbi:MAG: hypothetical protein AAGG11_00210 [Pseudomonadota bacterium]
MEMEHRFIGKPQPNRFLSSALLLALLTGCGGGGGGLRPETDNAPPVSTGVLLDSPVEGVRYATATQSGVTNSAGEFSYRPGETVSFSLGALDLGQAEGQAVIDLFELGGLSEKPSTGEAFGDLLYSQTSQPPPISRTLNPPYCCRASIRTTTRTTASSLPLR